MPAVPAYMPRFRRTIQRLIAETDILRGVVASIDAAKGEARQTYSSKSPFPR